MNFFAAAKRTFKNVHPMSVAFIYIGLELTVGLLAIAVILTLLEGHYGDYVSLICCAKGAQDAALTCGALSLFAAFLCDAAAKDKENNTNSK